jgi:hypothetical protein
MTRDAISQALDNLPASEAGEASEASEGVILDAPPQSSHAPEISEAEEVIVTSGTAVILYKLHIAQKHAIEPSRPLFKVAVFASNVMGTLRALALLAAIMLAMVGGGMIGTSQGVWMGILAMIGGTLALGGMSLFALQLAELFVFRGLARRA